MFHSERIAETKESSNLNPSGVLPGALVRSTRTEQKTAKVEVPIETRQPTPKGPIFKPEYIANNQNGGSTVRVVRVDKPSSSGNVRSSSRGTTTEIKVTTRRSGQTNGVESSTRERSTVLRGPNGNLVIRNNRDPRIVSSVDTTGESTRSSSSDFSARDPLSSGISGVSSSGVSGLTSAGMGGMASSGMSGITSSGMATDTMSQPSFMSGSFDSGMGAGMGPGIGSGFGSTFSRGLGPGLDTTGLGTSLGSGIGSGLGTGLGGIGSDLTPTFGGGLTGGLGGGLDTFGPTPGLLPFGGPPFGTGPGIGGRMIGPDATMFGGGIMDPTIFGGGFGPTIGGVFPPFTF